MNSAINTPDYEYELEDQRPVVSIEKYRQQIMADIARRQEAINSTRELLLVSDTINDTTTREVVLVSDTKNDTTTRELLLVSNNSAKDKINDLRDEPNADSIKTREVLKNKKIERLKNSSRDDHEELDQICLRPGTGEEQGQKQTADQNPEIVNTLPLSFGDNCSGGEDDADTRTTSRVFTGITAQQAISKTLKVFITLQTAAMAELGGVIKLTAELKRPKRIYELKPCEGDTDEFASDFEQIKSMILSMSLVEREGICLGRLHDCGKRDLWFANMCLLGKYNTDDVLETVTVYVDNEEYQIDMTLPLSPSQASYYKCSGIYGSITKNKTHPTWQSANVVVLK